ncbi:MAG: hypothetical protein LBB59_07730 [Campylobacteraceae bacterium]|jgi:hypothetical protein|nr:hypothetical protein [Campylobacteraceae bacterium]
MRVANYIQISQSDAQSFYDTLTKEKNFVIEGERVFGVDHRMYFSPNFDFKSQGYDELYGSICYAGIWGSAWESCNLRSMYSRNESVSGYIIRLTMAHQNNSLPVTTEAYFDEVFGHPNGAPDWELFSVVYENANMTAEINSYYEKIEASGVFDEGDAVYQAAMNTSG